MVAYEIKNLDPHTFEHFATAVGRAVLGPGLQLFSAGPDAGRDAYFRGEAPYPSATERWTGVWYIQAKCFAGTLGKDPQKWLRAEIAKELKHFDTPGARTWPDNWIIVSNVDPSGGRKSTFEYAKAAIAKRKPELSERFAIWGPKMLLAAVDQHPNVAARYRHFLTPGHVLEKLIAAIEVDRPSFEVFTRSLTADRIRDFEKARLEQAGMYEDSPPLHEVFIDLPFAQGREVQLASESNGRYSICDALSSALAANHQGVSTCVEPRFAHRSPVWLVKGGPGQGKTTTGQYFAQVHRAAICSSRYQNASVQPIVDEIRKTAQRLRVWPSNPRVPLNVELKEYSKWREAANSLGVLSYLAHTITPQVQQPVTVGQLRAWLPSGRWLVLFDGLDEVPQAAKDDVAKEILSFLDEFRPTSDLAAIFTTRPQGYAGQFDAAPEAAHVDLLALDPPEALACAELLARYRRTDVERSEATAILTESMQSDSVRSLLSSPLHAHIMAILVRGGVHPPQRKWQLFSKFYEVIYHREVGKRLSEHPVLGKYSELIRLVHDNLGFVLHARAEVSAGSAASLSKSEFHHLVRKTVEEKLDADVDAVSSAIVKAATERLVLISTPVDGASVRFDIRQLQEFFAATVLVAGRQLREIETRVSHLADDAHWREPILFLLSCLAIGNEKDALRAALSAIRSQNQDDDSSMREFAVAYATGPRLTFQLAQDGALEIDRQIRNEFTEIFAGLLDPRAMVRPEFSRIRGKQTAAWAARIGVDWLRSHAHYANYQAVRLLTSLVADDSPEVEQCKILLSMTPGICSAAMEKIGRENHCYEWHCELIVRVIMDGGVEFLPELNTVRDIIAWNPASNNAWEEILLRLPAAERRIFLYSLRNRKSDLLLSIDEVDSLFSEVVGRGAIWAALHSLIRYDLQETADAYRQVLRHFPSAQLSLLHQLPGNAFPRCLAAEALSYENVAAFDEIAFQDFLRRVKKGTEPLWQTRMTGVSLADQLAIAQSDSAVKLLGRFSGFPWMFEQHNDSGALLAAWHSLAVLVRRVIAEAPPLGRYLTANAWGLVVDSEEMQETMLAHGAPAEMRMDQVYVFHGYPVYGGRLGYAKCLVPLTSAAALVAAQVELRGLHLPSHNATFVENVHLCFPDSKLLHEVADDTTLGDAPRALAILLGTLKEKKAGCDPAFMKHLGILLAGIAPREELVWLAVALCVGELGIAQMSECRRAFGRFIRDRPSGKAEVWEAVFMKWRESSAAPFASSDWNDTLPVWV